MNILCVIQFHQKGCLPLLKPYLVCSREEVRKVVFWEGFCCFSCCIDSNWQPGTARTKLQSTKSDIYKPLNIYVFGQQHFTFFYLNNSNVCVWDTAVRFRGSLITFHWSCLPDAWRLESIRHNQDKMLNTRGDKWGLARNGIGKMPTSCWNILNISCWIFCV